MRKIFIILVTCLSIPPFAAIAQDKNKIAVTVEVEGFVTETFADVTCDQFDNLFVKTKKKVTFNDKDAVKELRSFMENFKQIEEQESINVRGKITFINDGKKTTYCFDSFAVFYNNGKYFRNVPLLHFIGKKIFDDDLGYLDR